MAIIKTLAFDADDTLWQTERYFKLTQARFEALLRPYAEPDHLHRRLLEAERRNIGHYGFGVKGFVLSMIETALEVTQNRVSGDVIAALLAEGQDMLAHPIELLTGAAEAIRALAPDYRMMIITKGDLLDQERKVALSGLGEYFDAVHIVSRKNLQTYRDIFGQCEGGAQSCLMVGNSMKSDVRPAIESGAFGVFIPQDLAWDLEHAEPPEDRRRFAELDSLADLPALLERLNRDVPHS